MRAGTLRNLITIQEPTVAKNAIGENVPSWATHAQVWARIEPLSGREYFEAAQTNDEAISKIIIRNLATVTPDMRISHNGVIYNIKSVMKPAVPGRMMVLIVSVTNG